MATTLVALAAIAPTAAAQAGGAPAQPASYTAASAAGRKAAEQAIRARSMQWLAAARKQDLDGVMANIADDAVAIYDGKLLTGAAAIRQHEAAGFVESAKRTGRVLSWQPTSVDVAQAGDLAYETGTFSERWDGGQRQGNYLTVWRRVGGEWKAVRDVSVPEPAAKTSGTP